MYAQMRRHKIVTRTLLILFITNQVVNFVFGTPVPVRERLEGLIDADGTEDGTAALQKQVNLVDEGSMNMAGQTPSSPDRWQHMEEQGMHFDSPKPLDIPGWSSPSFSEGPIWPPPPPPSMSPPRPLSPMSPTFPIPPQPPTSPPRPLSPMSPTLPPPLPEEPLSPVWPLTTDTSSKTGHQPTPQQSSGPDLDVHPPPKPEPHRLPAAEIPIDEFLDMLMTGRIKRPKTMQPPLRTWLRPLTKPLTTMRPPSNAMRPPPIPEPRPPAAAESPIDAFLEMNGRIKRPKTMQPPLNPGPRPLPNPEPHPPAAAEIPTNDFLDMLMRGSMVEPPPNTEPLPLPNPVQLPPTPGPLPPTLEPLSSTPESLSSTPELLSSTPESLSPTPEQLPPTPGPLPPTPEPRPLSNSVQPPPNPEPHPPVAAKPIDEFLDMLMRGKIKRTFPALKL